MKKGVNLQIILIAIMLAGSFILFSSSGNLKNPEQKNQKELCSKKKYTMPASEGLIWESLPHQFLPGS